MRQVQTEPKIEILLQSLDIAVHIVCLHIRSIGLGPAINIKFTPKNFFRRRVSSGSNS